MTVIPQFNGSSVNLDIPIYIRSTVVVGQHVILRPYSRLSNIACGFCFAYLSELAGMQLWQISEEVIYYSVRFDFKKIGIFQTAFL